MQWIKNGLLFLALLLGGVGQIRADLVYDTTYAWDGSSVVSTWGSTQSGATPTYGQTFVAPAFPNIAPRTSPSTSTDLGAAGPPILRRMSMPGPVP